MNPHDRNAPQLPRLPNFSCMVLRVLFITTITLGCAFALGYWAGESRAYLECRR